MSIPLVLTGCAEQGARTGAEPATGRASPVTQTGAGNAPQPPGVTPTGMLNPSNPPAGRPIATGLRINGAAQLVWFGRTGNGQLLADQAWYDPATGRTLPGPEAIYGAVGGDVTNGLQQVVAYPSGPGEVVFSGWLRGASAGLAVAGRGAVHPAVLLTWPADRNVQVFWVRVPGWAPPSGNEPDDRLAVVTATDPVGVIRYRLVLRPTRPPSV